MKSMQQPEILLPGEEGKREKERENTSNGLQKKEHVHFPAEDTVF